MNARNVWISVSILVLAFTLRIVALDRKPAHFDEGVNGWFVDKITQDGFYHYDPTNFHGPLHFYVLFVAQTLLGRAAWVLRLPIVLASTACVGLVLAYRRYLDERACQIAALMMAVSPGMVFYGRYAIHETWLLFFLLLTMWGLPGLWRFGERRFLWAVAMGITGMILTKETYVVHLIALGLALPCQLAYEKAVGSAPWPREAWKISRHDWLAAGGVSIGLIVFFYSGGFLDWPDPSKEAHPLGSICGLWETFAVWTRTGMEQTSGHEKHPAYWLQLLALYEWPALAGLIAGLWLLAPRASRVGRYIAIYGLGALIGYSIIRYKTPWCLISLMWPFHFVFGLAMVRAMETIDRWVFAVFTALLGAGSLGLTLPLNFRHYDDEREPYVYVQTYSDVNLLLQPLRTLTRRDARNYQLRGHLVLPENYPWLWTLADFPQVDFPTVDFTALDFPGLDKLPNPLDADFLVIDDRLVEQTEPLLRLEYYKIPMRIRGSADFTANLYLYTRSFAGLVPADTPIFVPGQAETPAEKPNAQ